MAKANPNTHPSTEGAPALFIRTTRKEGFRRAGLAIPQEGITVAVADLTEAQLQALKAEPMVLVNETTLDHETGE